MKIEFIKEAKRLQELAGITSEENKSPLEDLIASGDLTAPSGEGHGMQKSYYGLKNGSDTMWFKYDESLPKPFEVARVFGTFLNKQLMNSLGFQEKFSNVASKNLFEPPSGSNGVNLSPSEFSLLVDGFKKGFSSYVKSFSDFYKDRRPD
jgi:hypothetical protein